MRRFFLIVFMTTLAVTLIVGWFAPSMISWYFSPPVDVMNCKPAVEWGVETYRRTLLYGTALGLVLGILFALVLRRHAKPTIPAKLPSA